VGNIPNLNPRKPWPPPECSIPRLPAESPRVEWRCTHGVTVWPAIPLSGASVFRRRHRQKRIPAPRAGRPVWRGAGGIAAPGRVHTGEVRVTVWVRPGSARTGVGGEHDGALVVRVGPRALEGKATAAALAAIAEAFGVHRHDVTLVAGAASRMKIVDVVGADPAALDRLRAR
jgi:uncharacterized protein YggU (UPF0235/DUF167 family)